MKKFNDAFTIFKVIIVLIIAFKVVFFFKQDFKYEMQKLNISLQQFKKEWGNPDNQIYYESDLVLFYNSNIITGHQYVFKFDNKTKTLKAKFYDD